VILGNLQEYLPLDDLWKILVVCLAVAVVSPAAAALVINGFEQQSNAHASGGSRTPGDLRIALGVIILVVLIGLGIYTLSSK
jgi:hypothetical protein